MVYKKGWYVALVGEASPDGGSEGGGDDLALWFAVCRQNVTDKTTQCHVEWLENVGPHEYRKTGILDLVPVDCLLSRISFQEKHSSSESTNKKLILPPKSLKIANKLFAEQTGKDFVDSDDEDDKPILKTERKRKSTSDSPKKKTSPKKAKGPKVKEEKKSKKEKAVKKEKKEKKLKEPKAKKPKIDKSNPNWRLKPNLSVQVYEKDPLFETREEVPFVSSSAHSKLIIRAVNLGDTKLLNQYIQDTEKICSLNINRSMACEINGIKQALKNEDTECLKVLLKATTDTKKSLKRCSPEACLLPVHGTGKYNYRSLGIRHVRRVNLSRGSREGNNALTKDRNNMEGSSFIDFRDIMGWNLSSKFVSTVANLTKTQLYSITSNVDAAMRTGNVELAACYIEKDLKAPNATEQFSKFFIDALTGKGDPWDGKVRENSARKKAYHNSNVTPLHAACLNKDSGPLQALLQVCPDLYIADNDGWKLIHYAAVSQSTAALELLLAKGVPTEDPIKDGLTPLALACKAGRANNANLILKHNSKKDEDEDSIFMKKFGRGQVNKASKDSWAPIHQAVANNNLLVVKVLMDYNADANKPLNTKFDKITPLMLAAANGDLDMVRYLVKHAKIDKKDRYKRTALTHAIINGNANVASYLLSLGADANGVDSSGNSNLHYACAYGWWFCMKALLDAGAVANAANEWKLTPLSVAILKGNKGIGKYLSTLPGVDLEVKDDKGRTILLNMLVDNEEGLTNAKCDEIKSFVIDYKADPHCVDNDGKNPLHYIAAIEPQGDENRKNFFQNFKDLINFFLEQNVSTTKADYENKTPIQIAFTNKFRHDTNNYQEKSKVHFGRITDLLKSMKKAINKGDFLSKSVAQVLMKDFFISIDTNQMKDYLSTFKTLMDLMSLVDFDVSFLDELCVSGEGEYATNWTVFSELCKIYSVNNLDISKQSTQNIEEISQQYLDILTSFYDKVKPKLSFALDKKVNFHCLLTLCTAKDELRALKYIMKFNNVDVNVVNQAGLDALYLLIQVGSVEMVKEVLERGAEINRIRIVKKDEKGKVTEQDTPLLFAIGYGQPDMVELLLASGADVETKSTIGVSAIHQAVLAYTGNRVRSRLRVVQSMLDHGADINEWDKNKRTPLHIAINLSNDSSDFSMELEMLLLRKGACLSATDSRGRTPLHYAFVKIGKHEDSSSVDPIQIVSALVENMSSQNIAIQDNFGVSALHYAALRGSTVCLLLLLQKGAVLEARDNHQQTPLCYAVTGKHDGSALMLIQKDANLNVTMKSGHSLFQAILMNDWLGLTYITLNKMEHFGMKYVDAIEVAFQLQKLQFSKTLINKVVDQTKLLEYGTNGRNLMSVFAYETCRKTMDNSVENVDDVYELLVSAKVNTSALDEFGCNPMHYAFVNRNQILLNLLIKEDTAKDDINVRTKSGRTMLAASIWSVQKFENPDLSNIEFLISSGADVNELFYVPYFTFTTGNADLKLTKENFAQSNNETKDDIFMAPLHLAVLKEDECLIKTLLNSGADASIKDSKGLSALAYALKINNEEIFNLLLKTSESEINWELVKEAVVLDLLNAASPSYDNEKLVQKLIKSRVNIDSNEAEILQKLAYKHGAISIYKTLVKKYKHFEVKENLTNGGNENMEIDEVNYKDDAKNMLQDINNKLRDKPKKKKSVSPPTGCVVENGTLYKKYDILMNKVDVNSGRWGMYNFYRMQIWKDANKDLWILFTNWGRIERYGCGQYQNTPYSKPEEAEEEFRKIFKSKSGNDWDDIEKFQNKNGKYRLVKKEQIERVEREHLKFDLLTAKTFALSDQLAFFVKDISNVKMIKSAFASFGKVDQTSMPFGRIDRDNLLKARSILIDILEPAIKQKEKIQYTSDEKSTAKYQGIMENICAQSSEYHYLVPSENYAFEKLPPIEHTHELEEQKQRLEYLLDMSYTEKVLLGAMFKRKEVHPLDYIYSALKCPLNLLDLEGLEAQLIKKYMNQSRGAKKYKVWSIFSTEVESCDKLETINKKLLWHGTSRCHLISILHNGLVIRSAYSHKHGSAYGNGIYLADVFDKSISYCDGIGNRYMLLCEVDLSKCVTYDWHKSTYTTCCKVQGNHEPEEKGTLSTVHGYRIPAGKIVPVKQTSNMWRHDYNEYVVFDPSLVRIRYVVCLKDASNKEDISKEKILEEFACEVDDCVVDNIDDMMGDNECNDDDDGGSNSDVSSQHSDESGN